MARNFAHIIANKLERYHVSAEEAQELSTKVAAFRDAMAANCHPQTRCKATVMRKDAARVEAERIIRDVANRIRADRTISSIDKTMVRVKERPTRLRRRECPQTPPMLMFGKSASSHDAMEGRHIIRFYDHESTRRPAKPEGAARLELFVDLVPPGEPIPSWPGERWGGRMWYLRSYTRSPIVVEYPRCNEPMRVVYWARWAGANGETGPFSKPLAATKVEGFDRWVGALPGQAKQSVIITTIRGQLPAAVPLMPMTDDHAAGMKLLGITAAADAA
jgi:hypothetical protein